MGIVQRRERGAIVATKCEAFAALILQISLGHLSDVPRHYVVDTPLIAAAGGCDCSRRRAKRDALEKCLESSEDEAETGPARSRTWAWPVSIHETTDLWTH